MTEHAIANSSLSRHLGGEKAASSPRIRSWREGRLKKPRPDTCFRIGEALRSAGAVSSNGPLALIMAGYVSEFVALLISLSKASIQGDFIAMVLFVVCAYVGVSPREEPDADDLDAARERLASLFAHYGDDVSAEWERLRQSTQHRFVADADSSLYAAWLLAEHLHVDDELRETMVFEALLIWIRPRELLYPGFGTFAAQFLDMLRSCLSKRLANSYRGKPWGEMEEYFETWQRMWPYLMNMEYVIDER